jgi:N-acetyl-gamma-glutamyl-phosphate reductase
MDRGILTTAYSRPTRAVEPRDVIECLREFYAASPFVHVVDHLPATKDVAHSNRCHVTARVVRDWVVTISCLDNLIKGASGAAVQNMNVMCGLPEEMGLA